ncbi:MAG: DUF924 domain-containing protein [Chromatiaceae bacterium]|nr:DUF924 domain-containing protein [Gammaproteobacteria bacterium]MCP5300577.1 DUF924 domain-containing protein [Chromatiaceae bacterium]MCP5422649.1 DUF924 domain-containing protein [Chromatiaceae bacterium]
MEPSEIIEFWFAPGMHRRWFRATPELDAEIRERFEDTWHAAALGHLDEWQTTPEGALALAIVLDQLPLNMYRGRPESFATETQAVAVTKRAVEAGFDRDLPRAQLAFLYMPLMHSESIDDQDLVVDLFAAAGLEDNLRFARHHRELIRRFGRFPHRNAILGRANTPGERAYLASDEAFTG